MNLKTFWREWLRPLLMLTALLVTAEAVKYFGAFAQLFFIAAMLWITQKVGQKGKRR